MPKIKTTQESKNANTPTNYPNNKMKSTFDRMVCE